jgi:hypothetical protein
MDAGGSFDHGTGGMRIDQRTIETADDAAPVDMLAQLFEARGWPCEYLNDDEISGEIQGSWAPYQMRGIWRAEDSVLQLLCMPDVRAPRSKRPAIHELIALANEQLWLGHFELWSRGGVLLYRHGLMLGQDGLLGLEQAQAMVEVAVAEMDRFYPAFQFVLWGDKSPSEALDSAMVDAAGEA